MQLEAVVHMLKVFCLIADRYYEPVIEYVVKHKVYLVHALKAEMKSCSSVKERMKKKQWKQW